MVPDQEYHSLIAGGQSWWEGWSWMLAWASQCPGWHTLSKIKASRKSSLVNRVFWAHIPSLNSQAARLTIFSLILAAGLNSLLLSLVWARKTWLNLDWKPGHLSKGDPLNSLLIAGTLHHLLHIDGGQVHLKKTRWKRLWQLYSVTWSGGISPTSTTSSTSAMVILAALAMGRLKLLAVILNTRLPALSAFQAFTRAKSPVIPSSMM